MKPTLLLGIIGVAIAGLIGYHGIYARQREQVRLIHAQIAQEQANQQAQTEAASLLLQVERYGRRLPPEAEPSWLIGRVVALAEERGIQFAGITPEPAQQLPQFTRLGITLQFAASYHQLGALLEQLERAEEFFRIDAVDAAPVSDGSAEASVKLTVSTYYVPLPSPASGG